MKRFLVISSFISCYLLFTLLYLMTCYLTMIFSKFGVLSIEDLSNILSYLTIVYFFIIIFFGLLLGKKTVKENLSNYYLAALFFCVPTINASITQYFDKIEFGFGGIYPFGYGIISFFVKKVNTGDIQYSNDFDHKFNPDIFSQLFQNQWVMLQAISIIVAILFVILYSRLYIKALEKFK